MHNSVLELSSVAFHFCFGFGEFPARKRWLFALWAGDGVDREVWGHPQRVPSSSDQMLNSGDANQLVSIFQSGDKAVVVIADVY